MQIKGIRSQNTIDLVRTKTMSDTNNSQLTDSFVDS